MLLDLEYIESNLVLTPSPENTFLIDLEFIEIINSESSINTNNLQDNIILEFELIISDKPVSTISLESNIVKNTLDTYSTFNIVDKPKTDKILTKGMIIDDILHKKMLNIKDNKWEVIPIVNVISGNIDIHSYFTTYGIDKAYTIDKSDKYIDLFNNTVYSNFKTASTKIYSEIKDEYKPYDHKDISTVCWVKKKMTGIVCLIIGINYVGQAGIQLNQAISDADKFETFLKSHYSNSRLEIIKLTDLKQPGDMDFIETLYPTTANIMINLGNLINKSKDVIIYYAGHMNKITDVNSDDLDGTDEIINTVDGTITDDWFYTHFIKKLPNTVKCRLFFDGCYSSGFADFKYKYTSSQVIVNNKIKDLYLPKVICMSSSDESKVSYETTHGGIFTTKLLSELTNNGNFDVLRFRKMLDNSTRIMSTFEIDREPVLLL